MSHRTMTIIWRFRRQLSVGLCLPIQLLVIHRPLNSMTTTTSGAMKLRYSCQMVSTSAPGQCSADIIMKPRREVTHERPPRGAAPGDTRLAIRRSGLDTRRIFP